MKDQLSFTIDATNVLVLNETAEMLKRIANAQCPAMVQQAPTVQERFEQSEVFSHVSEVKIEDGTLVTPNDVFDTPTDELDVDSAGLPWDERIHTSTKSKVKDGTWMFKRSLNEKIKQAVLAEYGTQASATITGWDQADEMIHEPEADVVTIMDPPTPPAPEPVTPPAPPAPTPSASSVTSFVGLMPAIRAKGLDQATVVEACKVLGQTGLISFNHPANQHLIPELATLLGL